MSFSNFKESLDYDSLNDLFEILDNPFEKLKSITCFEALVMQSDMELESNKDIFLMFNYIKQMLLRQIENMQQNKQGIALCA